MNAKSVSVTELTDWITRTPVIAKVHPLVPLCLPTDTQVVSNSQNFLANLDDPAPHEVVPTLIVNPSAELSARFPVVSCLQHPSVDRVNGSLANNLPYAREYLLTNNKVAAHTAQDVSAHTPDVVVMLLVDGLSYGDVLNWPCQVRPCFIDGPTVTFRFHEGQLVPSVGFAAIINRPTIWSRLNALGLRHARGYTYWRRNYNEVADYMFYGIPFIAVSNFAQVLDNLQEETLYPGTYLQIVREGLDGLAHGKRELKPIEIKGAIEAILQDVRSLADLLKSKGLSGFIYLTSDHGVLWKAEHTLEFVHGMQTTKPRFSQSVLPAAYAKYAVLFESSGISYFLLRYPYIGMSIRTNDSGVHGGLSYQESIVPFCKFKV